MRLSKKNREFLREIGYRVQEHAFPAEAEDVSGISCDVARSLLGSAYSQQEINVPIWVKFKSL
jgi:hypothetical protein